MRRCDEMRAMGDAVALPLDAGDRVAPDTARGPAGRREELTTASWWRCSIDGTGGKER
jgi:hypothetical protein